MLTEPSKLFLRITPLAVVLAIVSGVVGRDRVGVALLFGLAVVAVVAGLLVLSVRDAEMEVEALEAEEAAGDTDGAASAGSGPAVLGGVAAALGAAAFVYGAPVAVAAAAFAAVAIVWWTAADAGDARHHPVNLLPVAIPVVMLFVILSIVFFMSRVLLAVPEEASTIIAMFVAIAILALCALVAATPDLQPSRLVGLLAAAGTVLVAAGLIAASVGERHIEAHAGAHEAGPTAEITAKALAFLEKDLKLPAGKPVTLHFKNDAVGVPHNVAIVPDETSQEHLFKGDIVVGPIAVDYHFDAPPPGTYAFRCDVHPNMKGKVTVS